MPTLDSTTRDRIVEAATALILENGYERTTMRAIAERAEVSLGSAYYYFSGKEDLVQGFYLRIAREHADLSRARMQGERSFKTRLAIVLDTYLEVSGRYRAVAESLVSMAVVPTSPLSPFSAESKPARETFIALYEDAIEGSDLKTDARLRQSLPELLWLVQMVVTLGWVQDLSPDGRVSRKIVGRLAPTLARLIRAARLKPLAPFAAEAIDALDAIKEARQARLRGVEQSS
ncbi:TetR family transcriptional regulator [Demequina capsici]|uniref:TetR family transcriptional regulator n=1 Tax=Demequina capsici TaxID=3075620 RepID=A0AA96F713_9MICO|nr:MULTISPECIES: TetR family transcriptional regulator [unclassified Demequina]WNM24469.1 TetR family transcriptional regulator [Demequina sp. OYTSA14]WNM27299.1 TetR family transcriptional regulator [Demequina sp. PMTSA13]